MLRLFIQKAVGILVAASLCVAVFQCGDPNDTPTLTEPVSVESNSPPSMGYGNGDSSSECDRETYRQVTVSDHTFWIKEPTLCNPNPEIYKGDPGPDQYSPWDERDTVTREDILRTVELYQIGQ